MVYVIIQTDDSDLNLNTDNLYINYGINLKQTKKYWFVNLKIYNEALIFKRDIGADVN